MGGFRADAFLAAVHISFGYVLLLLGVMILLGRAISGNDVGGVNDLTSTMILALAGFVGGLTPVFILRLLMNWRLARSEEELVGQAKAGQFQIGEVLYVTAVAALFFAGWRARARSSRPKATKRIQNSM